MNLIETLDTLNKVVNDNKDLIKNEESTKQFLILPLLRGLGYDIYSPQEVTPEFTADFHKKNEKVDYAISINGAPKIFVEAKSVNNKITKSAPQLSRYFSTFPSVRLGILTNGVEYHFFTDLNDANIMDPKPFFVFNITNYTDEDFNNLIKFSKNLYDYESIKIMAESLIYSQSFKSVIKEIFDTPNDDFIRFVIKERFKFKVTQQFINTARPLIQKSIHEALSELISEKFENVMQNQLVQESAATDIATQEEKRVYYSPEEIESLGSYEDFEGIRIVLPNSDSYKKLMKLSTDVYSVDKGNPISDFFVSSILMQGSSIVGYLIGQYYNKQEDTTLYTVKSNEIAKFLSENPIVEQTGFINAKLGYRTNKNTNEKTYYLRSCITNLSFKDIPNLVSKVDNVDEFFKSIQ
ncbi:type I restriction enzyme HsdR N-terminal domain-containing protein [Bacillus sp. ISL-40]|uniref:type I restriction endonuclease n=1 Tax=unclassified Bacillus (in: firmicutes) TaxID=185979 RepID=UPI001BEBF7EC|nr:MULTISPECIES: type I restriction endonuclease [unclassified Bacillus (in: firmicutes)]MBT2696386.1 type I restriction enzyme HsdR N-terminal domain-containing protein [Bacillus sp. ISL-40]MBT2743235.1 type I restriction enzyme HsdR N-terminal domain-containing protein [Bacillus sp. ISL-77]